MPPNIKITRQDIIAAAVEIVRQKGDEDLNARNIAAVLGCSTQPVFSNFASMEEVRRAVIEAANELCRQYIARETASGLYPPYKASGMAYIRFAKEEKQLFQLLYMRNRSGEAIPAEDELENAMETLVQKNTGVDSIRAKLFHLEMWACVHGIASMIATGFLELDWELISRMLTDSYQGLKKQYEQEET